MNLAKQHDAKSIYINWRHFFLYTKNEISERKIRGENPFAIAARKIKYLGIHLTKEVKYLYSENHIKLKKEIEEDTNKWKHTLCPWIGRINIIKISIVPKAVYRFNTISNKILMVYFTDLEQTLQNLYGNKKTPNSLSNLEKEKQSRRDHNTWYQTILQGHCNQNTLVLA